jgi:hypothetical protein
MSNFKMHSKIILQMDNGIVIEHCDAMPNSLQYLLYLFPQWVTEKSSDQIIMHEINFSEATNLYCILVAWNKAGTKVSQRVDGK